MEREERGGVMNNFYIAFAVYLNLIFVAAKLWGRVDWPWGWVMAPLIVMTVIGAVANLAQSSRKRRLRGNISQNLQSIRDLVENARQARGEDAAGRSARGRH